MRIVNDIIVAVMLIYLILVSQFSHLLNWIERILVIISHCRTSLFCYLVSVIDMIAIRKSWDYCSDKVSIEI